MLRASIVCFVIAIGLVCAADERPPVEVRLQELEEQVRRQADELRLLRAQREGLHTPRAPDARDDFVGTERAGATLGEGTGSSSGEAFRDEGGFRDRPGFDFYTPGNFDNAFRIPNSDVFIKPGGFARVHVIHDFNAIDSEDSFVTSEIPTDGPGRTNSRFHARPSRLNLDVRWLSDEFGQIRIFTEGDFFSDGNRFRLRHAYGQMDRFLFGRGEFLAGQTWTTFTDVKALPTTLDFESPVAFISTRRGQVRLTEPLPVDGLEWSVAVEDPRSIIELPFVSGEARNPLPDFVTRVRWEPCEEVGLQLALVLRELGFQPTGQEAISGMTHGLNFSGHVQVTDVDNFTFQVIGGDGIGSFWGIPDVAPVSATDADLLPVRAFMVALGHNWTDDLASNVIYSRSTIDNTPFQQPGELHSTEYLAVNLIWTATERLNVGVEYLYGTRVDVDRNAGSANRLEFVVTWLLP